MSPPSTLSGISTIPADYEMNNNAKPEYKAECISEFSLDDGLNFELGTSSLKYVKEEMVNKNMAQYLLDGIENYDSNERTTSLDKVLDWLMATAAPNGSLKEALSGCEFVVRRGPLARLAISPYINDGTHQRLVCTKYKGAYFIREYMEPSELEEKRGKEAALAKAGYACRKFETLITTMNSDEEESIPINSKAEFDGVFKVKFNIGNQIHRILCTGEIDAFTFDENDEPQFVKVKIQNHRMGVGKYVHEKILRWYFQSYLIGIKKFLIGYHSDFVLNKAEYYDIGDLLRIRPNQRKWKPEVCLNFLHAFLDKVKVGLDGLEEGDVLIAERPPFASEFTFTAVSGEEATHYEIISESFKQHGWKE